MTQVFKQLNILFAMMLMLVASGCSDDNEAAPNEVLDGTEAYFNFSFKSSALTRATTQAGTAEESTVNTIDIFIFDAADGSLLSRYDFTSSTMSVSSDKKTYSTTEPLLSSVGKRLIYAVVNLPSDWSISSVSDLTGLVYTASSSSLTADLATPDNFVMSSKTAEAKYSLEYWDGSTGSCPVSNTVKLNVQRAVAKFAMEAASNLNYDTDGGRISDLEFGLKRLNTATFAVQYLNESNGGAIQDPYYSLKASDTGYGLTGRDEISTWMSVFAKDASLTANSLYAPENTSAGTNVLNKTCIGVRGVFRPDSFMTTYDGGTSWTTVANASAAGSTFYVLKTSSENLYFSSAEMATLYFNFLVDTKVITSGTASDYILTYTNGVCYYTVYVNQDEDYNVYRNEFYLGTITEITGLGNPDPGTNPTIPELKFAYITVTVDVLEWELVSKDYTLGPQ